MIKYLEDLIPNRAVKTKKTSLNKILCIVEGKEELKYIVRVFELSNYINKSIWSNCQDITTNYIKVTWGETLPPNINLVIDDKCTFPGGGSVKGVPVPKPAMKSFELYRDSLELFSAVIVMFDKDKDKDDEVLTYFNDNLKKISNKYCLIVSAPCFESKLIDFCKCGNCQNEVQSFQDGKYPCDKYKDNFSSLSCFKDFSNTSCTNEKVSTNGLIKYLDADNLKHIDDQQSDLACITSIINSFLS